MYTVYTNGMTLQTASSAGDKLENNHQLKNLHFW